MHRHNQIWQQRLRRRQGNARHRQFAEFSHDPLWPQCRRQVELTLSRGFGAPVGEIDNLALRRTGDPTCGASTKLARPSDSQWYRRA
jgi:hypothetical protein